jgi:hypothetical protein
MEQQELRDFFNNEVRARRQTLKRVWDIRISNGSSQVRTNAQGAESALLAVYASEVETRYADAERLIILHVTDVEGFDADIVKAAEAALSDCMMTIHDEIKNEFRDDVRGRNPGWPIAAKDQFFDAKYEFSLMWLTLGIREKVQTKLKERAILRATLASAVATGKAADSSRIAARAASDSARNGEQGTKWTKRAAIGTGAAALFTAVAAIAAAWATWHPPVTSGGKVVNEQITDRSADGDSK